MHSIVSFTAAMAMVVAASNMLVQYPVQLLGLQDWLTWGALTYPLAFLITDLCVRTHSPKRARQVIYAGFCVAVLASFWLATPRIALASGLAFLLAQWLDVAIFQKLQSQRWWVAPLLSSLVASALDTAVFFNLAFSCDPLIASLLQPLRLNIDCAAAAPWQQWAMTDYAVKVALALLMLLPYRVGLRFAR
jgi:queuosine precursor transporter